MRRLPTRHPAAVALVAGAAAAVLVPVGAAVAIDSAPSSAVVEVVSADLVARGAAVDVTVAYTCAGVGPELSVQVAQRSAGRVISGSTYSSTGLVCDGTSRTAVLRVLAPDGAHGFKNGPAAISASLWTCGAGTCGTVSDNEEVSLRR